MPVDAPVTLRPFGSQDLAAAHGLSRAVAWPHRLDDWRMMAGLGEGFAATDEAGTLHGTALWWRFGADFATLGMVIVSPALQKAGIGRRLVGAVVEAAGGRRLQLNATVDGVRLYRSFGFEAVGGIHQHHGVLSAAAEPVLAGATVRPLTPGDGAALRDLDRNASGVDRTGMLETLLPLSEGFAAERGGILVGTVLVRDFGRGKLIGPLVAVDESAALALLSTATVRTGGFLRADIPAQNAGLARWLEAAGLPRVGQVGTMLRGVEPPRGGAVRIFGLASQALG